LFLNPFYGFLVGLVMALQAKVAFMHNQWTLLQAFLMSLSIGGMFVYYLFVENTFSDYYGVASFVFNEMPLFWFFGFFSIVFFTATIDVVGYYAILFTRPTEEMIFKAKMQLEASGFL